MPQRVELEDKEVELIRHHSEMLSVRLQTLMELRGLPLNCQLTSDGKAFLVPGAPVSIVPTKEN
jgi:hypothetical protein